MPSCLLYAQKVIHFYLPFHTHRFDPALLRMVRGMMKKVFMQLSAEFARLVWGNMYFFIGSHVYLCWLKGSEVIFATFNKIIICTSKTNCADGRRYIDYILGVIKSKPLFATLDVVPVQFWEHLVWMDQANYGGVEEVKENGDQVQPSPVPEKDDRRDRKRLHASGEQKKQDSHAATLVGDDEEATLFFLDNEEEDANDEEEEQVRPVKKSRLHRKTVNDDDESDEVADSDEPEDDEGEADAGEDVDVVPSSGRHSLKFGMPGDTGLNATQSTYAMQLSVVMQWNIEEYLPGFCLFRVVNSVYSYFFFAAGEQSDFAKETSRR
jgi:hypothetical protein